MSAVKRALSGTKAVDEDVLKEIIRRVVEVAHPEKIIMFGSAARGEMGPHSDIDLLVIKSGDYHRGRLAGEIYMDFLNLPAARPGVDIVVVKPEDVERYRKSCALVIRPALEEGKVVYSA